MERNIVKVLYFFCSEGVSRINSGKDKHIIIFNPLFVRKVKLPKEMALCINGAIDIVDLPKLDSMTLHFTDPKGTVLAVSDIKEFLLENMGHGAGSPTMEFSFTFDEDIKLTIEGYYEARLELNNSIIAETGFHINDTSGDLDG